MENCRFRRPQQALEALNAGANPDARDSFGVPALVHAARNGMLDVVVALLDKGAKRERTDHWGETPLMAAARSRNAEVFRTLVARGARLTARDSHGHSVFRYLLEESVYAPAARVPAPFDLVDEVQQRFESVRAFRTRDLLDAVKLGRDWRLVQAILRSGVSVNSRDPEFRDTALHLAARACKAEFTANLLAAGADPNLRDTFGHSALGIALEHRGNPRQERCFEEIRTLYVEEILAGKLRPRQRDLLDAVEKGDEEVVLLVLGNGLNVNSGALDSGETALIKAAFARNLSMVRLLLDQGAKVNALSGLGDTPLGVAVASQDIEMVRVLLAAGANPRLQDSFFRKSALRQARRIADPETAAAILALLEGSAS